MLRYYLNKLHSANNKNNSIEYTLRGGVNIKDSTHAILDKYKKLPQKDIEAILLNIRQVSLNVSEAIKKVDEVYKASEGVGPQNFNKRTIDGYIDDLKNLIKNKTFSIGKNEPLLMKNNEEWTNLLHIYAIFIDEFGKIKKSLVGADFTKINKEVVKQITDTLNELVQFNKKISDYPTKIERDIIMLSNNHFTIRYNRDDLKFTDRVIGEKVVTVMTRNLLIPLIHNNSPALSALTNDVVKWYRDEINLNKFNGERVLHLMPAQTGGVDYLTVQINDLLEKVATELDLTNNIMGQITNKMKILNDYRTKVTYHMIYTILTSMHPTYIDKHTYHRYVNKKDMQDYYDKLVKLEVNNFHYITVMKLKALCRLVIDNMPAGEQWWVNVAKCGSDIQMGFNLMDHFKYTLK